MIKDNEISYCKGYWLGYMDGHNGQEHGASKDEFTQENLIDLIALEAYERGWHDCIKAFPPGHIPDPNQPRAAATAYYFALNAALKIAGFAGAE